ncbi:hypothetical protein KAR28_06245 [Candidatus Parcubacteria bacterium]|nr:hypothetical protein [Candidatus Parcubacteria bacterium]
MFLENSKKLIHSKTFWTAMGVVVTSAGLLVSGEAMFQEFLIGVIGFVFIVLRMITHQPIKD